MSKSNLDVNRLAEINAKMMLKFVSSSSAVGVKILLAVGAIKCNVLTNQENGKQNAQA